MKNTFLILLAALSLTACQKAKMADESEKFVGIWKSSNFGGVSHEIPITKHDDETIILYGSVSAVVIGNTFESDPVNNVVYSGDLDNDNVLYFCQISGGSEVCGNFTK